VHTAGVNEVYLTRDGATAVTVSKDCTVRVWDVAAGECAKVGAGPRACAPLHLRPLLPSAASAHRRAVHQ
jgi:WD40 repeat protein